MRSLIVVAALLLFAVTASAQGTNSAQPAVAPFLMEITDIFSISGVGTVVTGKIERGTIKIGERVAVVGIRPVNVTSVSMLNLGSKAVPEAAAGSEVSLVLKNIPRDKISRGQLVVKPGSIKAVTTIEATIDLYASHERGRNTPIATGYRPQLVFRTVPFSAVVTLPPDKPTAAPGTKGLKVTIELSESAGIEVNTKFSIRDAGREVGTGTVNALIAFE